MTLPRIERILALSGRPLSPVDLVELERLRLWLPNVCRALKAAVSALEACDGSTIGKGPIVRAALERVRREVGVESEKGP